MSGLWRVKQKFTCARSFVDKKLYVFRTLPHVKTGANLTCTILFMMAAMGLFADATDLHLNLDGASDNVTYPVMYALLHLLLCAVGTGKRLRRIWLYRFKVGHTHNALDAIFGLISEFVYGNHSNGDARRNVLSFSEWKEVVGHLLVCLHLCFLTHYVLN